MFGWSFLILTGNIQTLWPLFGVANQLLACTALAVGTTLILREGQKAPPVRARHRSLPLVPSSESTTLTAAVQSIFTPLPGR